MPNRLAANVADGLTRVVAWAGLLSILLTTTGQLLGRVWWPLELASHFTVYYTVALSPGTVLFLSRSRRRRPRLGAASLVALVVNGCLIAPYLWPASAVDADATTFRVMSLNVLTSNRRHADVMRLIDEINPDVLALIEVDRAWIDDLGPLFEKYPTSRTFPRSDNFGVALFSRLPTDRMEVLDLAGAEVPSIRAVVTFEGEEIAVLATHPLPPISAEYAGLRNAHLAAIAEWSRNRPSEQIVMGDLNITPWSPYFRSLLAGSSLQDSGVGQGARPTWWVGEGLIGIAIDHVLHTGGLRVVTRSIGPDVGSDHRAVVVDFALAERAKSD